MKLEKTIRILSVDKPNLSQKMFDKQSGILFWDNINNPAYYELINTMREFFWIPNEVAMTQDRNDWHTKMNNEEKTLYKQGIGVLASLDSIATIFDNYASHYIQDSAIRNNMSFIGAMESIHNESYTYTMSSLVSKEDSIEAFEYPKNNKYIIARNELMMKYFDKFLEEETIENFIKSIVAMSALEGVCFVNGFIPFYHFARNNKMFGTSTIISFINRDELQHSYFQTMLVRDIMTQYPEQNTTEFTEWTYSFMKELVELEKDFCQELYKDSDDIDVFEVEQYIEFKVNQLLDNLGLTKIFPTKTNPMKWIDAFDPKKMNAVKTDFFEGKDTNYKKQTSNSDAWGDL